jgi:hypothetical protein
MLTTRVLPVALALALSGCAGGAIGTLASVVSTVGLPSGGEQPDQIVGEIQSIDLERQQLQILTHDGRSVSVLIDQNTAVVRQGEAAGPAELQRGDLVVIDARPDFPGHVRAERIHVPRPGEPADRQAAEIRQLVGRVGAIDQERGELVLETRHESVTVVLPFNAPQATVDFFRRLRVGDTVSLEAVPVTSGRLEIHRFL